MPNGLFKSLRFLWFVCFFVLTIAFFLLFSFIIHKTYENESLEQKKELYRESVYHFVKSTCEIRFF